MPEDASQPISPEQTSSEGNAPEERAAAPAPGEPLNDLAQAGYEPEGVSAGHLLSLIGVTLICIAAAVLSIYFVFYAPFKDHREQVAEDVNPNVEQVELRAEAIEALDTYGLTADSSYRIPVAEAMKNQIRQDSIVHSPNRVETRQSFNTGWVELSPAPAVASDTGGESTQNEANRMTPTQESIEAESEE